MKKKAIVTIVILLILVFIVSLFWSNPELKVIAGNYQIHRPSRAYSQILSGTPSDLDSISVYKYIKTIIYPTVENYDNDENYILVRQRPNKEMYKSQLTWQLEHVFTNEKSHYVADSLMTYDTYFKNVFSNSVNYYIIDIKKEILYGPFDLNEFNAKKKQLNINTKLR